MEHVLCVERMDALLAGISAGFVPAAMVDSDRLFSLRNWAFVPRPSAEHSYQALQLIPYVLIEATDSAGAGCLALYKRARTGEARLQDRVSCGVGGHINLGDVQGSDGQLDVLATLKRAAWREIDEEVVLMNWDGQPRLDTPTHSMQHVGWVYCTDSLVSLVHLGAVFHLKWPGVVRARKELGGSLFFHSADQPLPEGSEGWTSVCFDAWRHQFTRTFEFVEEDSR